MTPDDTRAPIGAPKEEGTAPRPLGEGGRYALVIGIDTYANGIRPLKGAVADAKAVAFQLSRKRVDRYHVITCYDEEATREGLKAKFKELSDRVRADQGARVLIYYAGHGTSGDKGVKAQRSGYFVPHGAKHGAVASYLSMTEVREALNALDVHHLLLVLDCCYAGAFRGAATRSVPDEPRLLYLERVERFLRDRSWHVIAAAGQDEVARDSFSVDRQDHEDACWDDDGDGKDDERARSPFTTALVAGLRGKADQAVGDARDGVITGTELHGFIQGEINRLEGLARKSQPGCVLQKPAMFPWQGHENDKGEFVFLNPEDREFRLALAAPLEARNNPYRGADAYPYDPSATPKLFFGRDALIKSLYERLLGAAPAGERVVLVVGASGVGKSSLVAAGLLPKLAKAGWTPLLAPLTAADDPMAALRVFTEHPDAPRVVVIDPLEELVAPGRRKALCEEFFAQVDRAVADAGGRLRVVGVLRSDFEDRFGSIIAKYPKGRFDVGPMESGELREAIEGPADARVLRFTPPSLVDDLIEAVEDAPGALPLLSIALSAMYLEYVKAFSARHVDRELTGNEYKAFGGVEAWIFRSLDRAYEGFREPEKKTMQRVMLRLRLPKGGQAVGRRALRSELVYGDADEDARVERVLAALTAARLLVRGSDAGSACVEPAHAAVVRGWPKLDEWLSEHDVGEGVWAVQALRSLSEGRSTLSSNDPRLDVWQALLKGAGNPFNADEALRVREALMRRRAEKLWARAAVAAAFAVLAGFSVVSWRLKKGADEAAARAVYEKGRAQESEGRARVNERLARQSERRAQESAMMSRAAELLARVTRPGSEQKNLAEALVLRHFARLPGPWPLPPVVDAALLQTVAAATAWVELRGHTESVTSASFSPDDARVLTVARDGTARVWNAADGRWIFTLRGAAAQFSPDGRYVVTTPDARHGTAPVARVWNARDGSPVRELPCGPERVVSASFSPDSARIVTASWDGVARVWSAKGEAPPILLEDRMQSLNSAAFSPGGARVVTASADRKVRSWGAAPGGAPTVLCAISEDDVAALSPDGRFILTGPEPDVRDGLPAPATLRLLDARTGARLRSFEGQRVVSADPFSPGASHPRLLTGSAPGSAHVWDLDSPTARVNLVEPDVINRAAFSADGDRVVTASEAGTASVWDARTGRCQRVLAGHTGGVTSAEFSRDGLRVVTASRDNTARIWNDGDGPLRWTPSAQSDFVRQVAFSRDGGQLIATSSRGARVWDARDHRPLDAPPADAARADRSLSSQGDAPIREASRDGTTVLESYAAGAPRVTLRGHTEVVNHASFSPDRRLVVTASDDDSARIWRASDGRFLVPLQGHTGDVTDAAFSPDGSRVVTASRDGTTRVWNASDGMLVVTLREDSVGLVVADPTATFAPDGLHVATLLHGTVRVWNLDPEVAARAGCARLRDGPIWGERSDVREACAAVP